MSPSPALDQATQDTLRQLADLAVPPPIGWVPQTWGWAMLAGVVIMLAGWLAWRGMKRRAANRYRREALQMLDRLEAGLTDDEQRAAAVLAMAELLKRVALAAWPRAEVATLSGHAWIQFLREHDGASRLPDEFATLLDDLEYRAPTPFQNMDESRRWAGAVRKWIEGHRVSV